MSATPRTTNVYFGTTSKDRLMSEHQAAYQPHAVSAIELPCNNQELRKQHFSLGYGTTAMSHQSTHRTDFVDHKVRKSEKNSSTFLSKFQDHWTLGNDAPTYQSETKAAFSKTGPTPTVHTRNAADQSHLIFGTDVLDYKTTSAMAHQEFTDVNGGPEEGRRRAAELRKSHLKLSSSPTPEYRSSYEADFVAHALTQDPGQSRPGNERLVFGNHPNEFVSESRAQYVMKACAQVSRPHNVAETNVMLGVSESTFAAKSETQAKYIAHEAARPPAIDSQRVRQSSIYLSGSTALESRKSVAAETYIAHADVAKAESLKPRGGTDVVFGFDRGGGLQTIEKELMDFVFTKDDQLKANMKEAAELKNELRSRKTNFLLGTDDGQYSTTTGTAFIPPKVHQTDAKVKHDLTATHYILGDNQTQYITSTGVTHVPFNVSPDSKLPIENSKLGTSVVIGSGLRDDTPAQSVAQTSYRYGKAENF